MKNLKTAIGAISVAIALSASAGVITISGSEFNAPGANGNQGNVTAGIYVTYSTEGTFGGNSIAQYDSGNEAASLFFGGNNGGGQEYAGVTVNSSVFSGTPGLGTLSQFYNSGSSFYISSMNPSSGLRGSGPGSYFAPYWVINLSSGANTLTIGLGGYGSTGANTISGSGYQVEWLSGAASFNANAGQNSTESLSTYATSTILDGVEVANWTVSSVGAEIGYWYEPAQNGTGVTTNEITSFTLNTVPEPNTIIAAALLLLPMGVGALRTLRSNRMA